MTYTQDNVGITFVESAMLFFRNFFDVEVLKNQIKFTIILLLKWLKHTLNLQTWSPSFFPASLNLGSVILLTPQYSNQKVSKSKSG